VFSCEEKKNVEWCLGIGNAGKSVPFESCYFTIYWLLCAHTMVIGVLGIILDIEVHFECVLVE